MSNFYRRNRRGVSEVVGVIMLLAITVVLFSSLFVWVQQLEGPEAQTHADFEATLEVDDASGTGYLNITHSGGEELNDWSTEIRLYPGVNGSTVYRYMTTNSTENLGETWGIGETFRAVQPVTPFPSVRAMRGTAV